MRFYYLFSWIILFMSSATAQNFELFGADTINRVDPEGRKQQKWIYLGKHRPGTCHRADQKVEEGRYRDNKKEDRWLEYYCNGNLKNRLTFANGRPDGYAQMFHENGKISEEGTWRNNRWIGKYKLYYDNGQVQHEFVFNQSGKREGAQKYYYENGQVAIEGTFVNGKESGVLKEFYENGDLKAEKTFTDGAIDDASVKTYQPNKPVPKKSDNPADNAPVIKVKEDEKPNEAAVKGGKLPTVLNGQYTLYNKNKQITKDGLFKDNRFIEGKAYIYDENGILVRIAVYRNGMYIGDTQLEN